MKVVHFKELNVIVTENRDGQGIIKTALQNLGGKATKPELQKELKRLGASESLYTTGILYDRLNKMRKRYDVEKVQDKKTGIWYYHLIHS